MKRPAFAVPAIRLGASLLGALAMFASALLHAAPQAGWWWNPAESGRGFFLEVQGSRMFLSGYFYADDGRPTWLVSNDPMPDANAYDGRMLAFREGQSLLGDYRHPSGPDDAGAVSLRFTDDTHGTLTWAGGMVPIERQDFHHGGPASFQPRTGWWWNPDESGRGFSIELQGDHMFIGTYMYDESGKPVWYVADALMQSPTRFSAPLLRFANGQTMAGAYHAPSPPAFVGTITIDFSASDQATVTLSDEVTKRAKDRRSIAIKPQYVKPVVVVEHAPKYFVGSLDESRVWAIAPILGTFHFEVALMTWIVDDELVGLNGGYPAFYKIASGFAVVSLEQTYPNCHSSGATSVSLSEGELTVNTDGSYSGTVESNVPLHVTHTCSDGEGHSVTVPEDLTWPVYVRISGTLNGGVMQGRGNEVGAANVTEAWSWDFTSRD
jgi:hypothetical protein